MLFKKAAFVAGVNRSPDVVANPSARRSSKDACMRKLYDP